MRLWECGHTGSRSRCSTDSSGRCQGFEFWGPKIQNLNIARFLFNPHSQSKQIPQLVKKAIGIPKTFYDFLHGVNNHRKIIFLKELFYSIHYIVNNKKLISFLIFFYFLKIVQ
ncbi:unnamed protein product [Caenorhabditis brenneri]